MRSTKTPRSPICVSLSLCADITWYNRPSCEIFVSLFSFGIELNTNYRSSKTFFVTSACLMLADCETGNYLLKKLICIEDDNFIITSVSSNNNYYK